MDIYKINKEKICCLLIDCLNLLCCCLVRRHRLDGLFRLGSRLCQTLRLWWSVCYMLSFRGTRRSHVITLLFSSLLVLWLAAKLYLYWITHIVITVNNAKYIWVHLSFIPLKTLYGVRKLFRYLYLFCFSCFFTIQIIWPPNLAKLQNASYE